MDTPAPAYNRTLVFGAAILGAVLFSAVFYATSESGPLPVNWPEWTSTPVHMTLLFALPPGLVLMGAGRLRAMGLVYLVVVMTLVHWLAMTAAINVATDNNGPNGGLLAGLAGGVVGAAGSWVMLLLLGPAFRTGKALALMLVATVILALIGAYGIGLGSPSNLLALLTGKPFQSPELDPPSLTLALYLPWQIVYGGALATLFEAHKPR